MLLRGLAKAVAVAVAVGVAGLALGIGLGKLSGGGDPGRPAIGRGTTVETRTTHAPTTTPRITHGDLSQVRVRALSAVLSPAATPAGRQRRRARLTVRVEARNGGKSFVSPDRPAVVVGSVTVTTDPRADAPGKRLDRLAAGAKVDVALEFEVAGAVTRQLSTQRRATVLVAGHQLSIPVTIGPPATSGGKPAQ